MNHHLNIILYFFFIHQICFAIPQTDEAIQKKDAGTANMQVMNSHAGGLKIAGMDSQNKIQDYGKNLEFAGSGFIENKGQFLDKEGRDRSDVLFKGGSPQMNVYLRNSGFSYIVNNYKKVKKVINTQIENYSKTDRSTIQLEILKQNLLSKSNVHSQQIDVNFINSNTRPIVEKNYITKDYYNYFIAGFPDGIRNVKAYHQIIYKDIYPKIDVAYFGDDKKGLKYDIVVHPGADPKQINLNYKGADAVELVNGKIQVATYLGNIEEYLPKVYQNIHGITVQVSAAYVLSHDKENTPRISYEFGDYNKAYALIIDPWITYYSGSSDDRGMSVTTDNAGNVYMAGLAISTSAIASAGHQNTTGGGGAGDAFLVKFNPAGVRLWATYYGGSAGDFGNAVATDGNNNVYMAGYTRSTNNISTGGAHQTTFGGGPGLFGPPVDAFLVKFNSAGIRQWGTYYGGTGWDEARAVTTDKNNNVYLAGYTNSTTSISSGGHQNIPGGSDDAFLVKFSTTGVRQWATYYGGTDRDYANGISADENNDIYISGKTRSFTAISTPAAHQIGIGGGVSAYDVYVAKFNAAGVRQWATYYGGPVTDDGGKVATDGNNNVYICGFTRSTSGIHTAGALQTALGGTLGNPDVFLAKLNSAGVRQWGTYLGGVGGEDNSSVTVDKSNNHVFLTGRCGIVPTTPCSSDPNPAAGRGVFVTQFYPNGSLYCSSYYGYNYEHPTDITTYGCYIYLTGYSNQTLTTANAHQQVYGGQGDAFLSQLLKSTCGIKPPSINYTASSTINTDCNACNGSATVNITSSCLIGGPYTYSWSNGSIFNSTSTSSTLSSLCAGDYWVIITDSCSSKLDSVFYKIITTCCPNPPELTIGTQTNEVCENANGYVQALVTSGTGSPAFEYQWSNGQHAANASGLKAGTYQVIVYDDIGCTDSVDVTISTKNKNCNCTGIKTKKKLINVTSLIPNPSFEDNICCPTGNGQMYCSGIWEFANRGSSDYMNTCGITQVVGPAPDLPLPGGGSGYGGFLNTANNYKEYLGSCLPKPMLAGVPYTIKLSLAYSSGNRNLKFAVFGTPNCGDLPWNTTGCPVGKASWTMLLNTTVNFPNNQSWQEIEVTFTPTTTIYAVAFGPDCPSESGNSNYYNIDNIILEKLDSFIVTSKILQSGDWCNNDLLLTASIDTTGGTWQWYDASGPLAGETNPSLDIMPYGAGEYTLIYTLGGECNAISYTVATTICGCTNPPILSATSIDEACNQSNGTASVSINNGTGSAPFSYDWSTGATTASISNLIAGTYQVTVNDNNGCSSTKIIMVEKDSLIASSIKGITSCPSCSDCMHWVSVSVVEGAQPFTYAWSGQKSGYLNRYQNKLCEGSGTITVRDANGCEEIISYSIP